MNESTNHQDAIELLQQLGLKEYEARCFVALARRENGTAKDISETSEVPRTRVYDAIRVLEAQGLVEVQHSSPQRFRAVPLDEATETLRDQYEARIERLSEALETAEDVDPGQEEAIQEVWTMSGERAIENRALQLIGEATDEVVLIIGDGAILTADLVESLSAVPDGVDLLVGTVSEDLQAQVTDAVPGARTFVSGLEWLRSDSGVEDGLAIGRLMLVDRSNILVSTIVPETGEEHAVFGNGFRNGLVAISRRLMAQGLVPARDPGQGPPEP